MCKQPILTQFNKPQTHETFVSELHYRNVFRYQEELVNEGTALCVYVFVCVGGFGFG
jgi:hypothetical protein